MKPKIVPTGREIVLAGDDIIVSKTDLAGRITYANRTFMRISGYGEKALLGIQHNIVRHPDMPRGAFAFLWKTLGEGREFFAYVKNMTIGGDHYWVYANVTPDRDARGNVVGYFSVRRKPSAAAVQAVEPLYRQMLEIEREAGPARAPAASAAFLKERLDGLSLTYDHFVLSL